MRSTLLLIQVNRRELRRSASVAQRGRTAVACPRACALPRNAPPLMVLVITHDLKRLRAS